MSFWSSLKKITLKGVIKDVEKVLPAALPVLGTAVAGPAGGLLGGLAGSAVKPHQSPTAGSEADPGLNAYGLPASGSSSSSSSGGLLGGIRTLGGDLVGAAKTIGSAELDRIERAFKGAIGAATTDIGNIATGIKTGASGAGAAIRGSNPTTAAVTGTSLWLIGAVVIGGLLLFKGKK